MWHSAFIPMMMETELKAELSGDPNAELNAVTNAELNAVTNVTNVTRESVLCRERTAS